MKEFEPIRKPSVLKPGDRVGLVTTVNLPPKQYRDYSGSMEYLKELGYEPEDMTSYTEYSKTMTRFFNDAVKSGVKALYPVAGNRYAERVVDLIDYEAFAKHRPIFITFSAASSLLLALQARANTLAFYGPHISFLNSRSTYRENSYTIRSFWNMLQGTRDDQDDNSAVAKYAFQAKPGNLVLRNVFSAEDRHELPKLDAIPFLGRPQNQTPETVSGRLFPTFLQSANAMLKKGVELSFKDKIAIIESDEITLEQANDELAKLAGHSDLNNASAVVLASFVTHRNPPNLELEHELTDPRKIAAFSYRVQRLLGDNVPVINGFPMGHLRYKLTVPCGIEAELHLGTGDITLNEPVFQD